MTSEEAKQTLAVYRPELDAEDPQFAEALLQAYRDPALKEWLEKQAALYTVLRQRLKESAVPPDLLQRILRSRPVRTWQYRALPLAASILILAGLATFWLKRVAKESTFENYRQSMARVISGKYRMSLETADFDRVRRFLANNQAPADYVLPSALQTERLLGCATLSWDGHPVSLLCFRHRSGDDLWLFITDRGAVSRPLDTTRFGEVGKINTAGWIADGNIYLLATRGDPDVLRGSVP
jgi:hypothetical protein